MSGREFGAGVRAALTRTGLTSRKICELLGWDTAKLSDLLNGKGGVTSEEVAQLLGFCRVPAAEHRHLMALFVESHDKGWLQFPESGVPDQVRTLIEQEQLATGIAVWSVNLVPGLLQTPGYAREVVLASPGVPPTHVDELVAARIARRSIFHWSREFTFLIHEQALHLPVGGPEVMSEQLHDLLQMSVRPYVSMRIVPTAAGIHAGVGGSFRVMTFPKFPTIVFLDSLNSSLFLEDTASVELYSTALESLECLALDEEQSRAVITDILA